MSQLTALEKHPCAACGAQAEWHPGRQRLVCPFCGTEAPYEINPASGRVEEIDLVRALRELPEELRGWNATRKTVQCRSCHAVSVFDPARVAQNCGFCGSPALVDYDALKAPIRPQSLLPFRVTEAQVRETIRAWLSGLWFAPTALARRALVDTVHGLYIPYWTFDAQADCPWQAEAGHYYYTTESYRDSSGRRRTRQVRHVRWEPVAGRLQHFFDDEPVPGTQGIKTSLLKQVEPFPTNDLVPYDTAYLSGFVVEHYQVVLIDAARRSQEAMRDRLLGLCAAEVPGDTYRNLRIAPRFSAQTFKHILVPVWLLAYTYGGKTFQVVVNGYTARMAGEYPRSPWKILAAVAAALLVVLLVLWLQG